MSLGSFREADPGEWNTLLDRAEHATVYHRSGWLQTLQADFGVRIRRLVWDIDATPAALWPIGLTRKGPLRIGGSPLPGWNTAYLGPVFMPHAPDKVGMVARMVRATPIRSPAFLATRVMDPDLDLSAQGFRKTRDFETYEIDLRRDEKDLWDSLKGPCRTRIRKGEKNGLTVRTETDGAYLDEFWRMAVDVFAKSNQRPPYSRRFLELLELNLRPADELLVTSAMHQGRRIATLIIPRDRSAAMYFAGGSLAETLELAPNNLLHWRTMMACKQLGVARYDFISNRGLPGRFKSTFSPHERVSCRHWEYAGNAVIRSLRDRYEQRARSRRKAAREPPR